MEFNVRHLGGESCVTGSCRLVQVRGLSILVDCGRVQGGDTSVPIEKWPVKPDEVDFIFLTHAHIDHIGLLPALIHQGFKGEIICSHPTKALLIPMLNDAMRFETMTSPEREKLAESIEDLSWGFEYRETFELAKDIVFELGCAGHILGSCFIRFEDQKDGSAIVFSGDLGNRDTPILNDPESAGRADILFLESTYGDRLHEDRTQRMVRLAEVLDHCLSDGGKVFIPAFSLGRTQEILYEIDRIYANPEYQRRFPRFASAARPPVFVDSPLAMEITRIYSSLAEFWDVEARALLAKGDHPTDFKRLYGIEKQIDHAALMDVKGPAVIIAGSGMCTGGRIVDHLAAGIGRPENDIVFVGYQAAGTPGSAIQEHAKGNGVVRLDGKEIQIRAGVHTLSGYSAHADQRGLLDWVGRMPEKPGPIKLVHGEPEAQKVLAAKLIERGYCLKS
jgi:metallo-beta-lactamase family protein